MSGQDETPGEERPAEQLLEAGRRRPSAAVRSRIRATIASAGPIRSRPPQLHRLIAVYAAAGLVLFALAVLGLAGAGPLGG